MKNQRRVFLKVIASGPLFACAGADAVGSSPSDAGAGGGEALTGGAAGAGAGAAGKSSAGAVSASGSSSGGNPFGSFGGTSSSGGNPFASSGTSFGNTDAGGSASGGGGGSGVAGSAVSSAGASAGGLPAGNASSIAVGSLAIVSKRFLLGRDAQGIYAMSLQCTHQSCAVDVSGNQLVCPCHKSIFDSNGNVLQGPATKQLPHFAVYVDPAGNISVDMFTLVSGSARVAG